MKLGSFEARFPFGLLVISDPKSKDSHDNWNPTLEKVHAGPDSLYVGVRDAASGLVSVTCTDSEEIPFETTNSLLFEGDLNLAASRLKFYEPDESICMIIPVQSSHVQVRIYADYAEEPSELLVQVMPHVAS
jgi:hypothetical protein